MDLDTTNISDLPINNSLPVVSKEEHVENMKLNTVPLTNDKEVVNNDFIQEKKVRFADELINEENVVVSENKSSPIFVFKLEYKIVILATFFFFVFMDNKFKKYILNILVQIFGSFLKTEVGNMNKIGMLFYSLTYALLLIAIVSFIDFSSFHLAF